jgi:insulysin
LFRLERFSKGLEIPSIDRKEYRLVRLSNGLEVFLVHDANADMASAAMDVNVGSFSDEDEMPGMAHGTD